MSSIQGHWSKVIDPRSSIQAFQGHRSKVTNDWVSKKLQTTKTEIRDSRTTSLGRRCTRARTIETTDISCSCSNGNNTDAMHGNGRFCCCILYNKDDVTLKSRFLFRPNLTQVTTAMIANVHNSIYRPTVQITKSEKFSLDRAARTWVSVIWIIYEALIRTLIEIVRNNLLARKSICA